MSPSTRDYNTDYRSVNLDLDKPKELIISLNSIYFSFHFKLFIDLLHYVCVLRKAKVRCGSRICVRGGGPAEFLPTSRSGVMLAAKIWASKWRVGGPGGPGPQPPPPLDQHLKVLFSEVYVCPSQPMSTEWGRYILFLSTLPTPTPLEYPWSIHPHPP